MRSDVDKHVSQCAQSRGEGDSQSVVSWACRPSGEDSEYSVVVSMAEGDPDSRKETGDA